MVKLRFLSGALKGQKIQFDHEVNIGRSESSAICIPDSSVSFNHCVIQFENGKPFLRDLQSTNGTWLKGEKISAAELRNGDVFQIGEVAR